MAQGSDHTLESAFSIVCQRYGLGREHLRNYYYRHFLNEGAEFLHHHGNSALSYSEACKLIVVIQCFARERMRLSTAEIVTFVENHFHKKWALSSARRFLRAHPEFVKGCHTKSISIRRTDPSLFVDYEAFAEQWNDEVQHKQMTACSLVTYDETIVSYSAGRWRAERWNFPGDTNDEKGGKACRVGSLINFINAAGEHLFAVWVLKIPKKKKKSTAKDGLLCGMSCSTWMRSWCIIARPRCAICTLNRA